MVSVRVICTIVNAVLCLKSYGVKEISLIAYVRYWIRSGSDQLLSKHILQRDTSLVAVLPLRYVHQHQ